MGDAILEQRIGHALVITFNRPEVRSPLSIAVVEALASLLQKTEADGSVRGIIFTGVDDVFASGADLREVAEVNSKTARPFAERGQALMSQITRSSKATIAAVNGYCFGGALDLTLSCRYRIASPSAQFSHPGAALGIMTGWGGTQRLPRLVGEAAALEMFLTAKRVGSGEALKIGLVDEVAADPLAAALARFDSAPY